MNGQRLSWVEQDNVTIYVAWKYKKNTNDIIIARQYFVFSTPNLVQVWLDRLCGFSDHMTGSMSNSLLSRNIFIYTYKAFHYRSITHALTSVVQSWFQTVVNSRTGWLERKWTMSQEEFEEQLLFRCFLITHPTRQESHYLQILCGPDMLLVKKPQDSPLSLATGQLASKNQ